MFNSYDDLITIDDLCDMLAIGKNTAYHLLNTNQMIIPELSEPPVRTLGATIPENESHIFR